MAIVYEKEDQIHIQRGIFFHNLLFSFERSTLIKNINKGINIIKID